MPDPVPAYVRYSDSVETPLADEERVFDEIAASMRRIASMINDRSRHATRSVHAKSHGLLKADFVVADGLPEHLGEVTQDLLTVNGKSFPNHDAAQFLHGLQILEKHVNDSEALKQFVSTGARAAETVLEAFHSPSAALLGFGYYKRRSNNRPRSGA